MSHKKVQRIDPLTQALPAGGIDTHAHLDDESFNGDREEVLSRASACGVTCIGNIFMGAEGYAKGKDLFEKHPNVFFIMGIHPCDGQNCSQSSIEDMARAFENDPRLKAVGEIGLDYYWQDCPRELQLQTFKLQLDMARQLAKPIVIHCRDAVDDCLTILEANGFKNHPLLWHCFGGDTQLAKRIIYNGWHISIPGPVTYPANKALREAITLIPEDRLLLETDCPYLSPVPWRGTRNEPAYTVFTGRKVAETRGEEPEVLWEKCAQNSRRFFGL